jgi:hypothetical protein
MIIQAGNKGIFSIALLLDTTLAHWRAIITVPKEVETDMVASYLKEAPWVHHLCRSTVSRITTGQQDTNKLQDNSLGT